MGREWAGKTKARGVVLNMKNEQLDLQFDGADNDHLKSQEMQGFLDLKLKKEALELARYFLEQPKLNGDHFCKAVAVVEDFAGKSKRWFALIETAYGHVNRRDQEMARKKMLIYCSSQRNREAVLRYLPRRINNQTDCFELLVCWEVWLENDRMDLLEKSVSIMSKAIQTATASRTRAWLASVYAKYWAMRADLFEDEELEKMERDYLDEI